MCQPRVIVKIIVEKQMECRLCRGNREVLGENLSQRYFCLSQNPTWPDPGLNQGRRGGKPATNRLSYGAAKTVHALDHSATVNGICFVWFSHTKKITVSLKSINRLVSVAET
jgi:hypothetical protein